MCGIVAYLGKKVAQPILIEGLKRLEYRGYDSAGVALLGNGAIRIKKGLHTENRMPLMHIRIWTIPAKSLSFITALSKTTAH
jgi:asparagine synthetase B (glutamine-hydrolysing)